MNITTQEYVSAIIEQTETITDKKVSEVRFDESIVCEVLSYDKDKNKYYVTNGATKFFVSNNTDTKFTKGSKVYVLIPKGDYTGQSGDKVITGMYKSQESVEVKYLDPDTEFIGGYDTNSIYIEIDTDYRQITNFQFPNALPFGNYDYAMIKHEGNIILSNQTDYKVYMNFGKEFDNQGNIINFFRYDLEQSIHLVYHLHHLVKLSSHRF